MECISEMKNIVMLVAVILGTFMPGTKTFGQPTGEFPVWSVGTSLTYPLAKIYQLHIGCRIDSTHEIIFGPAYQNFTSGSIISHAYTVLLGYRYHAWKGLSVELELWPASNRMHSDITALDYPGTELWAEIKIGYRVDVYRDIFLHPAAGIGFGIFRTNPPPHFDEDITSHSFAPQLILGVNL